MYNPNNQLFQIQKDYVNLLGLIEEAEGEITPEIDEALQFTAERLQTEGAEVACIIKTLEYWGDNLEKEIGRLVMMQQKATKSIDLLRSRLKAAMEQFGIERIASPYITVSFRKSEAVEIASEALIPLDYKDPVPPKIIKNRIREALKAGKDVPGAELVQRKNLQIK